MPRPGGQISSELQALNRNFAVMAFGADGRILRANNLFLRLFGYELDEVVGQDAELFAQHSPNVGTSVLSQGRHTPDRARIRASRRLRKDGSEIWIEGSSAAIRDADGQLVETVAIITDVTRRRLREAGDRWQIEASNRCQAVVQFRLDGTILAANDIFLSITGYRRDEVVGRHHRDFLEPGEPVRGDYARFWSALGAGLSRTTEQAMLAKDGRKLRLQANFNPVFEPGGSPATIAMYAVDVTAERMRLADYEWQVAAIHKSHAVISFDMRGIVLDANRNFLEAMGYELDEIVGRHHRMFVESAHAHSTDYMRFWRALKKGEHRTGQYKRVGRDGRNVWLQATYNPVFDMDGHPVRVVKYATVVTDDKLQQTEYEGQIAAIHRSQCVLSLALDGTILDANDNFLELTGYRYGEVLGRHHRMLVTETDAAGELYGAFWRDLGKGEYKSGEFKRIGKDGREIWLQANYNPVFDMDGRPFKVVKYATDITAAKLLQADHTGQIQAINKSQGVMTLALDGTILDANENVLSTFGYDRGEVVGRHHGMLVEPDYAHTEEYRDLWRALRTGAFHSGMCKRIGKDGREIWLQASYNPILDLNGQPYKVVKFATDVTSNVEIAAAFEDAKRQAQHDAATSLPNRLRLASFMTEAMPHPNARLAVFYIDLDRFKPINDAFGHAMGDRLLGEIADRFRRLLGDDQLIARVGGDEFVIAAPDLGEDAIEALCRRIVDAVSQPIHTVDGELRMTASVGVAVAPVDGATPDDLLRCADAALQRCKRSGAGTYGFFASEMNQRIAARRKLIEEMRRAITVGEFFLEYQPRFETASRTVRSVEALVRWSHPERGRIAPADFIPLAESSGLIVPLGQWILETACRTAASVPRIGISVNVSPVQFRDCDLVAMVERALADSGLSPHRLELEVTEGALLDDAARARVTLERLKALGVKLAIDDFGTGYSSMSYLCDYPFDVIKIDRKFISDIEGTGSGNAVIQAIVGLGRALGLSITAEGVETERQLEALINDRCDEVQGYLLSRPVSWDELPAIVVSASKRRKERETLVA